MARVAIVGGGISGLSAAYFVEQQAAASNLEVSIELLERRERLGGVIVTERSGDFLVEGGPDSFLTLKPAAVDLCDALGLAQELLPSNDDQRTTYVLQGGRLKALPQGMMFVAPAKFGAVLDSKLFSLRGKLRLALWPWFARSARRPEDVSAADFVRSRFGSEALERLAEPLLAAVYGADVDSLSARAALPQLVALEEKHGSLWRGLRQTRREPRPRGSIFTTLRHGLGQIVSALQKSLYRTEVATRREITAIRRSGPGAGFCLEWRGGTLETDALILATPAHAAAHLVRGFDPRLGDKLDEIPYHSSVIVALGYEHAELAHALEGFGFVVPRSERRKLIACTCVSTKFAYRSAPGTALLRCFLGGARDPGVVDEPEDQILQTTLRELREVLRLRTEPTFHRIYRWEKCMPQYRVGHLERLEEIASLVASHPGLFLSGNGYRGVGIPDCIQSSAQAATAALAYLQSLG